MILLSLAASMVFLFLTIVLFLLFSAFCSRCTKGENGFSGIMSLVYSVFLHDYYYVFILVSENLLGSLTMFKLVLPM